MPAPVTIDDLLALSQKSGIVPPDELEAYQKRLHGEGPLPSSPEELAHRMIRDGVLTPFQAGQLLKGKWRNFILAKRYRLMERLGVGGMGSVFLCEQVFLRRRVALKVLPPQMASSPGAVERFYREGRAVAALDHPNIVKVYDTDHEGKLHFLVMEYVDGATLHEVVSRAGPLDPIRAAHYIAQAALGLQHAHELGLVHRDIKPSNLLLDRQGTVKILDLGLARFFYDGADNITREHDSSAVLGTADYMPPEQALDSHNVDIRGDIYSLGATFYFLLTGGGPFPEGSAAQKILWHQLSRPKPVRERRPEVAESMAAVLDRMMDKDPRQRYQTPIEVADALVPWTASPIALPTEEEMPHLSPAVAGPTSAAGSSTQHTPPTRRTPTSARALPSSAIRASRPQQPPPTAAMPTLAVEAAEAEAEPRRGSRWLVPAVVGAAAVLLLGTVGTLAAWWAFHTPANPTAPEPNAPGVAVAPPDAPPRFEKEVLIPHGKMGLIHLLSGEAKPGRAVAVTPDERFTLALCDDGTLGLWNVHSSKFVRTLPTPEGGVVAFTLSADGKEYLSVGRDGKLRRSDLEHPTTDRVVAELPGPVACLAVSPDGKRAVCGQGAPEGPNGGQPLVLVVDTETGKITRRLKGHTRSVGAVAFLPDGRRVVSAGQDGMLRLWDAVGGTDSLVWRDHAGPVHAVAVSPDGKRAASAGDDKVVRVWDVPTGKVVRRLKGHADAVRAVVFSPDGRHVLSAGDDQTARAWEVETGYEVCGFTHPGGVRAVAFDPDARLAVTTCTDGRGRIWGLPPTVEVLPVGELARLEGHTGGIVRVALSPDGRYAVSASKDHSLRLWDLAEEKFVRALKGHTSEVGHVAVSPDGRLAVSGGQDGTARVWDLANGKQVAQFTGHKGKVWGVVFTPDGKSVLSGAVDQTVCLWEARTGTEIRRFPGHTKTVNSVDVSPDGRLGLSTSWDGTARVWDLQTGQETFCFRGHRANSMVRTAVFTPDGRAAVSAGSDGVPLLWDVATGTVLQRFPGNTADIYILALTPDGRYLAAGNKDSQAILWDVAAGRILHRYEGHTASVSGLAVTPDCRRLVTGAHDNTLRIWGMPPLPFGTPVGEIRQFDGHTGQVERVAVSPDGRLGLSVSFDRTARLWELGSGRLLHTLEGHGDTLHHAAFSHDGRLAATAGNDQTVRLWDVATGKLLNILEGHKGRVWAVAFTADDRQVVSGGVDGTIRLWDVKTGRESRQLLKHTKAVNALAVTPDGRTLVSAGWDGKLYFWDLTTGSVRHTIDQGSRSVHTVAISHDGRFCAADAAPSTVKVWNLDSGAEVKTLKAPDLGALWYVSFSPDGKRVVAGGDKNLIALWDATTGNLEKIYGGHTKGVTAAVFLPDGRRFLSGSHDRTVRLWGVPGPTTLSAEGTKAARR